MEYAFKKRIDARKLRDAFMTWYRPQVSAGESLYIPLIRREVVPGTRFVLEIPKEIAAKFAIWEALRSN